MRISRIACLLAFVAFAFAGPVSALEMPANRPTNDPAALERQLNSERDLPSGRIEGFTHIPDQKEGVLIQPQGRWFRDIRTRYQPYFDGALIIIAVGAMMLLYFVAGPMRYTPDARGRRVKRFTNLERFVHWTTSVSFVWLALSGLNLVFGRWLLAPVIGDDAFAALSHYAKLSHNSVGIVFILALIAMTIQWVNPNLPSKIDLEWIKRAGGMFGGPHPPARKFNAGQKMIYWLAVFGGGAICLTGIALLTPFYVLNIAGMQYAHLLHSGISALMIAAVIGHIYLGSVGVRGSLEAMTTGSVDRNWAHEHHPLWLEELDAKRDGVADPAMPMRPAE